VQQFNHEVGDGRFVFNGFRKMETQAQTMSLVLEFGRYAPLCIRQSVPTVFWTKKRYSGSGTVKKKEILKSIL
jgi:hypothetical protein